MSCAHQRAAALASACRRGDRPPVERSRPTRRRHTSGGRCESSGRERTARGQSSKSRTEAAGAPAGGIRASRRRGATATAATR